ncbi:MAG: hypothetical protein WCT08_01170 [Patescibacteria group bacterium]|jgi:hypothetical protein
MVKINRQTSIIIALISFIILILSFSLPEENGAILMMIGILGLIVGLAVGINSSWKRTIINKNEFDLVYTFHKTNFISPISVIFNILSLLWLLIAKIQSGQTLEIALIFFIGFWLLSAIELIVKIAKQSNFDGFTFGFNKEGITLLKGDWVKKYAWENYRGFNTAYSTRYGEFLSYLPYISIFFHETDKYTINLFYSEKGRQQSMEQTAPGYKVKKYHQIETQKNNLSQVISYLKKYLPQIQKDISLKERL